MLHHLSIASKRFKFYDRQGFVKDLLQSAIGYQSAIEYPVRSLTKPGLLSIGQKAGSVGLATPYKASNGTAI